jgi:hypothetical protein
MLAGSPDLVGRLLRGSAFRTAVPPNREWCQWWLGARAMIDTITRSFEKNPGKARIKSREVLSGGPVAREQRHLGLRRLAELVADLLPPSTALNRSDVLLLGLSIVATADELLMM